MKLANKMNQFSEKVKSTKLNLYKNKYYYWALPVLIIIVGIFLISFLGFNKGIDFTGGTVMNIIPDADITVSANYNDAKNKINNVLSSNGLTASYYQLAETENGKAISVKYQDKSGLSDSEMEALNLEVREQLFEEFGIDSLSNGYKIQAGQRIGATASSELLTNALIAILVSCILILIYIAIRFEMASGLAAIVALVSDVLVVSSLVLMFRIQINSSFIAALITIIGYSINNTIIIFDRVRENLKLVNKDTISNEKIIEQSVRQTFVRTLNTTITTLIAVVFLVILGVPSIRQFVLPIIFGLIAGTYSSIFVSPALWAVMYRYKEPKKKIKQEDAEV